MNQNFINQFRVIILSSFNYLRKINYLGFKLIWIAWNQ